MFDKKQADIEIGNASIEDMIQLLEKENNEANVYRLVRALEQNMEQNGQFFIPVLDIDQMEQPPVSLFEIEELNLQEYFDPPRPLEAVPRKVELFKGGFAFTAFTSREELNKGESTKFTVMPIRSFFELALSDPATVGIVLNPWDVSVLLDKNILSLVLQGKNRKTAGSQVFVDQGDITRMNVDAIVNAANTSLMAGGGVCGAIFAAAGPRLHNACAKLGGCEVGQAKLTEGFDLPARYIIHTPGPVYSGSAEDEKLLAASYYNALEQARLHDLHSIAFPSISTGIYGYPIEKAVPVAAASVSQWIADHPEWNMEIHLVAFDDRTLAEYLKYFS